MYRILLLITTVSIFGLGFSLTRESKYEALRVRGSDSEVNLVQAVAEKYMDLDSTVSVGVTGGGSGAGIAALINGKTDLANSSRQISEEEIYFANKRGVYPYPIIFAQDALAIIVNESNPMDSITLSELADIYSGEIKNWSELSSGEEQMISLYGRQSSSGTYTYFRDVVVKQEYDMSMIGMSGTAQIIEAIRGDLSGIGYVSSGYIDENVAKGLKVLKVKKDENSLAYSPMEKENIVEGYYPITRPLYQYTNGKPVGTLLDFILFQFSEEGTAIIESNGFYPVDTIDVITELIANL